jgi:hypothetical protein
MSRVSLDASLFDSERIGIFSIEVRCPVFDGVTHGVGGGSASTRVMSSFEEVVAISSYSGCADMVR